MATKKIAEVKKDFSVEQLAEIIMDDIAGIIKEQYPDPVRAKCEKQICKRLRFTDDIIEYCHKVRTEWGNGPVQVAENVLSKIGVPVK